MRSFRCLLVAACLIAVGAVPVGALSTWPVYHANNTRTANDTSEPNMLPLHTGWTRPLDGKVYAEPLVFQGRVFAATENNTLYALDAHDGHVLWSRHLGRAMTNVKAQVGCGNIDPLGITSTPAIDTVTGSIFVVTTVQDAPGVIHHQMIGLDALTGAARVSVNADPGGGQNPLYIQQRAALALGNGRVYFGYGGYSGDCGPYHGWLMAIAENGSGKLAFNVTPHTGEGAVWAVGGPSIDGSGNVYIASGNPNANVTNHDYGESVLKFDATLHVLHNFSSSNATDDLDIGSTSPALLGSNLVFQVGKQSEGYLLDATTLQPRQHLHVCDGGAKGGTAYDGSHLFVSCDENERIREINIDRTHGTMSLGWAGPAETNAGPPIITGGVIWSVDYNTGTLYGMTVSTGASVMAPLNLGVGVPHFVSPTAALGLLLIGTNAGVTALAGPSGVPPHAPSACTPQPDHNGYWMTARDGTVFAFGGAPNCGSLSGTPLNRPIVGIAGTSGPGYWLVASDGGVFAFNRPFYGSTGAIRLKRPIVGIAATPSGKGYWLVASDGGVFTFGDAVFRGSTGARHLNRDIVGMASTPSGKGYWLVASDGGIFTFGDAHFFGSTGALRLKSPIISMATTTNGHGYWLVAFDGGIFRFGDAAFHGSAGGQRLSSPVIGMAAPPSGTGYWLAQYNGGVLSFNVPFRGSATAFTSASPVISISHD